MAGQSEESMTSRRRLLQAGALTVGVGLLGARGTAIAGAPAPGGGADGTGAGADGAPPPPGAPLNRLLAAEPTEPTSYNGWTVGTPGSTIGIVNYAVPGTSVVLPLRSGDVTTILGYVARRFNAEVEPILKGQCWGYDYRPNVNNPSVWSNHASGTAIDLNSLKHPNGAAGTFTAAKIAAVRRILAFCGDVVYWGEDYRGVVDGMHFEIDVPPSDPAVAKLAAKTRQVKLPVGAVDVVSYLGNGNVRVAGWAFDPDQSTAEIPIAIYADGIGIGWFPTGVLRSDVNAAYDISGRHGYEALIELGPGAHSVDVYAINTPTGDNPLIGTRSVQVGVTPFGWLDSATPMGGSVNLGGWAYDADDSTAEIQVAVYIDGGGIGWFPTGRPRPDVNRAFGITGDHGYNITIPCTPGRHLADVYAINVKGGVGNPGIGSMVFTI